MKQIVAARYRADWSFVLGAFRMWQVVQTVSRIAICGSTDCRRLSLVVLLDMVSSLAAFIYLSASTLLLNSADVLHFIMGAE